MKYKMLSIIIISLICLNIFSVINKADVIKNNQDGNQSKCLIVYVDQNQSKPMQIAISNIINEYLRNNIIVYWLASNITGYSKIFNSSEGFYEKNFEKGCFLIPLSNNSNNYNDIINITSFYHYRYNVSFFITQDSFSDVKIYKLYEPKIANYDIPTVDNHSYRRILNLGGFTNQKTLKQTDIIRELNTDNYNVLTWGGGNLDIVQTLIDNIGPTGLIANNKIKNFIKDGGGYIGSCYGGWKVSSKNRRPIGVPLDLKSSSLINVLPFQLNIIDRDVYRALPGGGPCSVRIVNFDNPISFGLPEILYDHNYWYGPMFLPDIIGNSETEDVAVLEDINEERWDWDGKMDLVPWFNSRFIDYNKKMDICEKWVNYSLGKALWVSTTYGNGKVVAFGSHPENIHSFDRFPYRVVFNSAFYASSKGPFNIDIN